MLMGNTPENRYTEVNGRSRHQNVKRISLSVTAAVPSMQGNLKRAVNSTFWCMGLLLEAATFVLPPYTSRHALLLPPSLLGGYLRAKALLWQLGHAVLLSASRTKATPLLDSRKAVLLLTCLLPWDGSNSRASSQAGGAVHPLPAARCSGCPRQTLQKAVCKAILQRDCCSQTVRTVCVAVASS